MPQTKLSELAMQTGILSSSLFRQAIINGGFDVWQRNTTVTYNDDTFGPDRWNLLTETNGAWTCARDTDVPTGIAKYSAKFTNVTLNNQAALVYLMENVDAVKFQGKTVSLSFYAKTNTTEIANLRCAILSWTGTADAVTSDVIGTWAQDGTNPTWATNYTMENTPANLALTSSWQRFKIENIAIDTSSITNLAIVVWVDDGTIAANDDFFITGIQLNEGPLAMPYQPKKYGDELDDCQRYCFAAVSNSNYGVVGFGWNTSTTVGRVGVPVPVNLRTTPTFTASAAASSYSLQYQATAANLTNIALSGQNPSNNMVTLECTVASGLTAGDAIGLRINTAGDKLIFDAEL